MCWQLAASWDYTAVNKTSHPENIDWRTVADNTYTADLAYRAITEGMDALEDFYLMEGGIITVNTETAAAMGADCSAFAAMGTVVEVTTNEE